jgi:D-lyxose ketol-isomerase
MEDQKMKRSEINRLIVEAKEFFDEQNFRLPPFAFWTPQDWKNKGPECDEIRDNLLGWDLTDFGSGDFYNTGLLLFTLRNGNQANPKYEKPYAEKIMIVREKQVTPMHFHWSKMEDIINRGGGELVIELNKANPKNDQEFLDAPFEVTLDGVVRTFSPGEIVRLKPGESITLERYIYHRFWVEGGMTLVGEVSCVNDDSTDNRFHETIGRFPEIEEDEVPIHYLCTEYPAAS